MNRSPLRTMSAKRQATRAARRKAVADAADRDGHRCQAQLVWRHDCYGGLVGHEPHKRSAGGNELDADQILTVCSMVNSRIEDQPVWARDVGLSVHAWHDWSWTRDWRGKR